MSREDVSVSPGLCLLLAWFGAAGGWRPLLAVLAAAAAHESGHLLALRACRAEVTGLRLGICGAVMEADCRRLSYGEELLCVLAGPAANLLAAPLLAAAGWTVFAGANAALCLFNLVPVRPLDGGRALELLVSWAAGPAAGEWAARWIGASAALAVACCAWYVVWRTGGTLWLLPPAAGLLCSALAPNRR